MAKASEERDDPRSHELGRSDTAAEGLQRWRTAALVVLAALAILTTLSFTRSLLLPVLLAVLLHFLLSPFVRFLSARGLPQALAATGVLLSAAAIFGYGAYSLSRPAFEAMETVPDALHRLGHAAEDWLRPVQQVTEATESVEALTDLGGEEPGSNVVQIERPSLADWLFSSARELATTSMLGLVLLYFLLAVDDAFLSRLVAFLLRLEEPAEAIRLLLGVEAQISRYLVTVTVINALLGAAIATALWLIGLPNPLLWGLMAALLNYVPYLGAVAGAGIVCLAALSGPAPTELALAAGGAYLTLSAIEGTLLTPAVLGRSLTLSPVVVFIWLMVWNWLWGVPGALLAVPMLVAVTIFCDNVASLVPLARLLRR